MNSNPVLSVLIDIRNILLRMENTMSEALDRLTAEVKGIEDIRDAVKAFVTGLAAEIKNKANDDAALNQLADRLHVTSGDIAASIMANTPGS